jgi:5-methylcytosine-specific restriction endonuclease McrA
MAISNEEGNARRRAKEALNRVAVRAANKASYLRNAESRRCSARNYYAENSESCKMSMRAWVKANPDKARVIHQNRLARLREVGGRLSSDLCQTLFAKQHGLCVYCEVDLTTVQTHLDHRIPVARGGANADANMQLLCARCNRSKSDRDPDEFERSIRSAS